MNAPSVPRQFEIGAPSFERRLQAAQRVQAAGYPVRVRLDPIVPVEGWREEYAETIGRIFEVLEPERITLGTLRFEPGFFRARKSLLTTGDALEPFLAGMAPMFEPQVFGGKRKVGKYSFTEEEWVEIFSFALGETGKHAPDVNVALCKESAAVWEQVGLNLSRCACVCQVGEVDIVGGAGV
jgi:spore photoproduct lyase